MMGELATLDAVAEHLNLTAENFVGRGRASGAGPERGRLRPAFSIRKPCDLRTVPGLDRVSSTSWRRSLPA